MLMFYLPIHIHFWHTFWTFLLNINIHLKAIKILCLIKITTLINLTNFTSLAIGVFFRWVLQRKKELSIDLVKCINAHILALQYAGCKHIQIDEPILVRSPDVALDYLSICLDHLSMCLEGVRSDVTKTVHLCCGYPNYLVRH